MKMFVPGGRNRDHYPIPLHGIYTSIIPEENEDILAQSPSPSLSVLQGHDTEDVSSSVNEKTGYSITDEVKKLGLTAELTNKNRSSFEPYWIEVSPKVRVRRRCVGLETDKEKLKDLEIVQGSTKLNTELLKVPQLRSPTFRTCPQLEIKDIKFKTSFKKRPILNTSQKDIVHNSKTVENKNENSYINERSLSDTGSICSSVESINSIDEASFAFSDVECNVFKRNEGLRRTNSETSLRKITDGICLPGNKELQMYQTGRETIEHSDIPQRSLRRISSTSDIKELDNTRNSIDTIKDKDIVSQDDLVISQQNNFQNINLHRPRSQSIGVIKWARTNKIRHNKRENNMYSPTSF